MNIFDLEAKLAELDIAAEELGSGLDINDVSFAREDWSDDVSFGLDIQIMPFRGKCGKSTSRKCTDGGRGAR